MALITQMRLIRLSRRGRVRTRRGAVARQLIVLVLATLMAVAASFVLPGGIATGGTAGPWDGQRAELFLVNIATPTLTAGSTSGALTGRSLLLAVVLGLPVPAGSAALLLARRRRTG